MRTWPRLTEYQRDLITRMARDRYGDLHEGTRDRVSVSRLQREGMVQRGCFGWFSITQRGRDYVRFGLPKKRVPAEKGNKL